MMAMITFKKKGRCATTFRIDLFIYDKKSFPLIFHCLLRDLVNFQRIKYSIPFLQIVHFKSVGGLGFPNDSLKEKFEDVRKG